LNLSRRQRILAALRGKSGSTNPACVGFKVGTMSRLRIAEWSYQLGCVSAAVAIVYRVLWFGGLGARLFGAAPRIIPHNFLDLSILLFVISIASFAHEIAHHDYGKSVTTVKAA
jgi:hypothetical protein